MKKLMTIFGTVLLAFALTFSVSSCGGEKKDDGKKGDSDDNTTVTDDATTTVTNDATTTTTVTDDATTSMDWDDFLNNYERFVDKYISIAQKMKADPTDMSAALQFADLALDFAKWGEKTQGLTVGSDGLTTEHFARLMDLALKLSEAAY